MESEVKKAPVDYKSRILIPGQLPTLNKIIEAAKVRGGSHNSKGKQWNRYSEMKRKWTQYISGVIGIPEKQHVRFFIEYNIWREDRRTDPSNIFAGYEKIILDALEHVGLIAGDGWKHHRGSDFKKLEKDKENPKINITITELGEEKDA